MGQERVFRGHPHSIPGGGTPASLKHSENSFMRTYTTRKKNQIWHGDQTRCEEKFFTVDQYHKCLRAIYLRYVAIRLATANRSRVGIDGRP